MKNRKPLLWGIFITVSPARQRYSKQGLETLSDSLSIWTEDMRNVGLRMEIVAAEKDSGGKHTTWSHWVRTGITCPHYSGLVPKCICVLGELECTHWFMWLLQGRKKGPSGDKHRYQRDFLHLDLLKPPILLFELLTSVRLFLILVTTFIPLDAC